MLLPLAPEPFSAPADRDLLPSERREFVRTHRTCVFGYPRRHDGPAMSVVYYVPTTRTTCSSRRWPAGARRSPSRATRKVSLCLLDERWPFSYLQVYADAVLDTDPDLVVDVMMAVGGRMSGQALGDDARPSVEAMAEEEQRVVIRCRPYSTFAQHRAISIATTKRNRSHIGSRAAFRGTRPTHDKRNRVELNGSRNRRSRCRRARQRRAGSFVAHRPD